MGGIGRGDENQSPCQCTERKHKLKLQGHPQLELQATNHDVLVCLSLLSQLGLGCLLDANVSSACNWDLIQAFAKGSVNGSHFSVQSTVASFDLAASTADA